jgi:hypothetical protein
MTSTTATIAQTLLAASLVLAGCSSQVVSSHRTPGADLTVQGLRVVFEDSPLQMKSAVRVSDNVVNQQRLLLGNSIVERLPEVFTADKVPASSRTLPPAAIPASRDFSTLFPAEQHSWHTLVVTPVSGSVVCSANCDYHFRLSLRLIEPASRQIVWSATIDQPAMGGVGTRKAIYDYYANDIGKLVLKEIKQR